MRRARYRRWTQPSLPLRPSTADPAQGPQTAIWEVCACRGRGSVLRKSAIIRCNLLAGYGPHRDSRFGVRVNASVLRAPQAKPFDDLLVYASAAARRVWLAPDQARVSEEWPRAWRPIEPGELHAVLASTGDRAQRGTMYGLALVLGRIASGGCGRGDAAVRQALSHRVVNSGTAQPHTFAQPQCGSSISHLLAVTRAGVIAAAQLSTEQAGMREERPPAGRSTEPEPHAALASAANGQPEDR